MTNLNQVRVQHPVGHGFFHSSTIRAGGRRFDYIVDCGGVRSAVVRQVRAFKDGRDPRELDLLVVSHFHADHVSGLEDLLSDVKVKAVAVPYLSPDEKLLTLAMMASKPRPDANEDFLLRPVEWATARGAAVVYLVHGDGEPPATVEAALPAPPDGQPRDPATRSEQLGEWRLEPGLTTVQRGGGGLGLPHTTPLEVRSHGQAIWSFNFFCYTNPALTKQIDSSLMSKTRWAAVRGVRDAIARGDSGRFLADKKTRKELKDWYAAIVKTRMNLTSLCLLSMPSGPCSSGVRFVRQGDGEVLPCPGLWDRGGRVAWLGTGDATLKQADVAAAFLKRFEPLALGRVGCMSLPHHGSAIDHNGTVLDRLDPTHTFVTCPAKKNSHHPSPAVERAVRARGGRLIKVTEQESSLLCEQVCVWRDPLL
jgi:hypothetical protein